MWLKKNKNLANQPCSDLEPLLLLSIGGEELTPSESETLASHIAQCANCAATLDREKEWIAAFAEHQQQPDATLLASCRSGLIDALDREDEGGWLRRTVGSWIPSSWLSPEPAWSAAVLLVIGFAVGILGPRFLLHH